ncbi:MAG TPA: tRNA adenosine(34) deaminase TadA [Acidimicrobiales bacterium]|nr:tRNA adenosine(34) deaminase TadA [Acidimicrobiales bacterium]
MELSDEQLMFLAIEEAKLAMEQGEVPIGAVVLLGSEVIARAHNGREGHKNPVAHAEILALEMAAHHVGDWRLGGSTLVVTLEPCTMCAGALVNARVDRVVFGAADPKAGACGTLYNLCSDPRLNHEVRVTSGVLEAECSELLRSFFSQRRSGPEREIV